MGFRSLVDNTDTFMGLAYNTSIYSAFLIKEVHDYPESVETIEKKIERFRSKLRGGRGDEEI